MGNPIVHWELLVNDLEVAKKFYSAVFDWTIEESSFPGYPMIQTGAEPNGAMMAKPDPDLKSALTTYFGVDDIEESLTKAVAAGATLVVPRTPIPGVGYWAMFNDPDGIPIGLFQAE